MKKLFLVAVAVMMTAFNVNAQVKISSPHPDLDIQIKRCAYASGTVVIDLLITNFGPEEQVGFYMNWGGTVYSTAYDDEGNVYNNIGFGLLSDGLTGMRTFVTLPQDIPLKFRAQINKVNPNATKFTLLKIAADSNGALNLDEEKPIQIHNIEWVK